MDYETPQFYRVAEYAAGADRDVVDMASGNPDWDPPEGLRDGLREFADLDAGRFQYPPSAGLRELREEIAARRGVGAEQVIVTNGTGEANHLAMLGALDQSDGEEILLTDPVYPYYAGRANFVDADVTFVPVDDDGRLDPGVVREHASDETAAIVVNTPNNPTGAVYDGETVAGLVAAAEDHDAVLISDEVYDHFDYSGRFESALGVDSPNRVVTSGFSKSMAITGLRVGYAVFPDPEGPHGELVERARTRHMLTNVTGSRPAQYAVLRALETTRPDYYAENRRRMSARIDAFCEALGEVAVEYDRPDGGFYVMARFEGLGGSMDDAFRLIDEAGVAPMPGAVFGERRADWLRFALLTPRVEEACERLRSYFG
ncbi:MAG: pyridoxal phosphate-dependent aminotransferase [Haloarculaceae archaeon]